MAGLENLAASVVEGVDSNFYGTTQLGGQYNEGTVFRITPAGVLTVLHSFGGNGGNGNSQDGVQPMAELVLARDGNFHGTTQPGGSVDAGTVFQMTPAGAVTVLYSFTGGGGVAGSTDGWSPQSALI